MNHPPLLIYVWGTFNSEFPKLRYGVKTHFFWLRLRKVYVLSSEGLPHPLTACVPSSEGLPHPPTACVLSTEGLPHPPTACVPSSEGLPHPRSMFILSSEECLNLKCDQSTAII